MPQKMKLNKLGFASSPKQAITLACLSAMIRYVATKLDVIESALTAGYLSINSIPYTEAVDELMEGFIDYQAQVYKKGAWTKPTSWESRSFNFGEDIGKHTCYSMFFEELRDIPNIFPTPQRNGILYRRLELACRSYHHANRFCWTQTCCRSAASVRWQIDVVGYGKVKAAAYGGAQSGSQRSIERQAG